MRLSSFWKQCGLAVLLAATSTASDSAESSPSLYENAEHVTVLDKFSTFEQEVMTSDSIWMIQFFKPDNPASQELVTDFALTAQIMRGMAKLGAVDMSTAGGQRIASKYLVDSFPTVFLLGDDKNKPVPFDFPKRDAQNMVQALMETMQETLQQRADPEGARDSKKNKSTKSKKKPKKSRVVEITDANFFDKVLNNTQVSMIAFTAPWCGHCKRLQPIWEAASTKLESEVGDGAFLGWVDATAETGLAQRFEVRGYPTIKMFPGGAPKTDADGQDYFGERIVSAIVENVLKEVDKTGSPKEIPELVSSDVLQGECSGHNHICILAALPHILDSGADGRNKYRDTLTAVSKKFRTGSAFSFLWFEGSAQPELEQALELTFGFPAVVALSVDRLAYAVFRGSYSEKAITSFLHGLTTGRQRTIKLDALPAVASVEPWNGEDAEPPEEEMSLDEIMGWDDEDEGEKKEEGGDEL